MPKSGQYESEWSIENFMGPFLEVDWDIRSEFMFYLLKKKKKIFCFVPAKGTFHLITLLCITVQAPNTLYSFLIIKGRLE